MLLFLLTRDCLVPLVTEKVTVVEVLISICTKNRLLQNLGIKTSANFHKLS